MRIIVFAGVFDPVHNGHIAVVEQTLAHHKNAKAVVVAEKLPQHKHGTTSYQYRYEMLRIAFEDNSDVEVLEAPISEHTIAGFFTWLNKRFPNATFSWIVGSDVLTYIESWRDSEKLSDYHLDEIVCFERKGSEIQQIPSVKWTPVICLEINDTYKSISSKKIRNKEVALADAVPKKVATYINTMHFYDY